MVAFAYVYEIFTVTQLQIAVTKSNKKFTEQTCGRFCFQKFYTSYIKYSCMLVYVYWRRIKFISIIKNWPNLPMNKIQVQFHEAKLHV